ncbi:DUF397 domain-containing protein [Actinomadura decatromicini]|uniref:DUF397 domain-containing protein n=2 Tax=Actinomadura decatromicini TaxID=2604572 RepID=A0A5D3FH89_9ACTN|nr:DUF397 domain-containing protein [Actinomadura decatromicini]
MIHWRKSSHSMGDHGECVEVSTNTRTLFVRDSKAPEGARLALGSEAWVDLVRRVKSGALDL